MNPIIRNLTSIIRRFKLAVVLNILGLSVAFAAFMVIMIQLNYDLGFDKFHKDHDKIFRVESSLPMFSQTNVPLLPRMFAEAFFESSPHIIVGALSTHSSAGGGQSLFYVETETGARNFFREQSVTVSPEFFDVFTFDFVEGSATDGYIETGDVFMPLSIARKIFGNQPAVGRHIISDAGTSHAVVAVYRDFPSNTVIGNHMYFAL
jgi:putative ABC transport system permease protein